MDIPAVQIIDDDADEGDFPSLEAEMLSILKQVQQKSLDKMSWPLVGPKYVTTMTLQGSSFP